MAFLNPSKFQEVFFNETTSPIFFLQEIDELLSGGLTDEDEEDIMNELAELEKLELPSVPDTEIVGSNDAEEELPDVPTSEPGMCCLLYTSPSPRDRG